VLNDVSKMAYRENRESLVDLYPDGHAFFAQDVDTIIMNDGASQKLITSKYGTAAAWSEASLQRLTAWGFNVIGSYAHSILWPGSTDNGLLPDAKVLAPTGSNFPT